MLRFRFRRPPSFTASVRSLKMSTDTGNSTKPTNQHISVGPDGKVNVDLTFVEEPLGMPASDGYGWPQFKFGETLGPEKRYTIVRKLGWGMTSSTWLARDLQQALLVVFRPSFLLTLSFRENQYVAIKGLNGYTTDLIHRGRVWELEALKLISSTPNPSPHCLNLLSSFTVPGKGSSGEHICLVTQLLGGDAKTLHEAQNGKIFPFPLAKRILLHVLRGIAHAHRSGVVHTDLKHDNIFFDTRVSTAEIQKLVASEPALLHPPEASHDGIVQAAVSQPLPVPALDEAMKRTYVVADFGSGRFSAELTLTPY